MESGIRLLGDSELAREISRRLKRLAEGADPRKTLEQVIALISEASGCESVGIRWRASGDCPYYVTRGFGVDFVVLEGPLCARDAGGLIVRHPDGTPQLACMCGAVVEERTDPSLPYFTPAGSFWTNGTTRLLDGRLPSPQGVQTRNYCNVVGYESVALIPLRARGKVHGLLQLNSRTPDRFEPKLIAQYEEIAGEIADELVRQGCMPVG